MYFVPDFIFSLFVLLPFCQRLTYFTAGHGTLHEMTLCKRCRCVSVTRGLSFSVATDYGAFTVIGMWEHFWGHKVGDIVQPPPSISDTKFLLGVLTWFCFSKASLLIRLLAVVSPTQINPQLVITEQQIFMSILNLGKTFSWTSWLVMSSTNPHFSPWIILFIYFCFWV